MKHLITFFIISCSLSLTAQPPQLLKYQGIARDSTGNPVSNDTIALRISIHQGNAAGTVVYRETHSLVFTNQFGSFSINIGGGTVNIGSFFTIPWSRYNYFQEVEMDVTGGNSFVSMGTSKYLSVPYALNGASSGFSAHLSSSFFVPANGSSNVIFDVIDYNDGNNFSAGVFTAPSNGFYHFDVTIFWNVPSYTEPIATNHLPSHSQDVVLFVNGTPKDATTLRNFPTLDGMDIVERLNNNIYLTSGQVVSVGVSVGAIGCTVKSPFGVTQFSGYKIY